MIFIESQDIDHTITYLEDGADEQCMENQILMMQNTLKKLLDVFERCEAVYPPKVEIRFLARDLAKSLEANMSPIQ